MDAWGSLDHFVGAGEQRVWHFEAERFCCLEIDDQLELGWILDWQVSRFRAVEDAIDVACCAFV